MTNRWRQGLVNGAPYLCSALIGCWTTKPLNHFFGRRGCIFICCFVSFAASIWMAAAHTWWNLLLGRFFLGFAVGAKSTTTPVYGAECSPAIIRGALVMMWQVGSFIIKDGLSLISTDVDCLWNHAWIYCICGIYGCFSSVAPWP